jgi:hypothetical protein
MTYKKLQVKCYKVSQGLSIFINIFPIVETEIETK